ncbi:hypothetical protein Tco_1557411 [Tanacetum coccineum]
MGEAANRIGCGVLKAPFAYLGSKVEGNMSRIKSWDEIVDKMVDHLSKWKMKTLSIGGRLTLLKAVLGSMPIYHMSIFKVPMKVLQRMESIRSRFFSGVDLNSKKSIWVKWSKVLCSKVKGGLGVSSLYALNRALMYKWIWRFTTQKNLLWTRVIKAIHGEDGKNGSGFKVGYKSIWRSILQEVETLKIKGELDLVFSSMWLLNCHNSHGDNRRNVQTARPCFYADFMKCQPLNFKGTEGVVGLTRWIEKMESVFNISGCAIENQVKFSTCTLLGAALTWWNGQMRTLGPKAYAMTWEVLKKKMTDKYCLQGEIKKLEIELWNLKVKGNDVPAYTEHF